jgi:hypothetical protein
MSNAGNGVMSGFKRNAGNGVRKSMVHVPLGLCPIECHDSYFHSYKIYNFQW